MKIAIWTKSPPKVKAIEEASKKLSYLKDIEIEFVFIKASSDVSDMPLSLEENLTGAKNRVKNTKIECPDADFYIGMEWWTQIIWDKALLFWVTYVENMEWKWHFGFSSMMEVPEKIKHWLYEEWKELWPLMSELSWQENIGHKNWSFGLWTDDAIIRQTEFETAFICAISPFFNTYYK